MGANGNAAGIPREELCRGFSGVEGARAGEGAKSDEPDTGTTATNLSYSRRRAPNVLTKTGRKDEFTHAAAAGPSEDGSPSASSPGRDWDTTSRDSRAEDSGASLALSLSRSV